MVEILPVSTEGISIEHIFDKPKISNNNIYSYENSSNFNSFMTDDSSQDSYTTEVFTNKTFQWLLGNTYIYTTVSNM